MAEWQKVESTIVKWDKKGDELTGELINRERGINFDNDVYSIRSMNGSVWTVFGTTMLSSLMASIKVGSTVRIVYTGDKPSKNGLNKLKTFEVYTK